MGLYVLHTALAFICFLVVLNGFLRGAKKQNIDVVLSLTYVGLLSTVFWFFGWLAGALAFVLSILYALLLRPVAARAAARLFAHGAGERAHYPGLPSAELGRISRDLGATHSPEEFIQNVMSGDDRKERALEALLNFSELNHATKAVMEEFGATKDTLRSVYLILIRGGAGQWSGGHYVAASAIAYPDTLRYLLSRPLNDRNSILEACFIMLERFERGAILPS